MMKGSVTDRATGRETAAGGHADVAGACPSAGGPSECMLSRQYACDPLHSRGAAVVAAGIVEWLVVRLNMTGYVGRIAVQKLWCNR